MRSRMYPIAHGLLVKVFGCGQFLRSCSGGRDRFSGLVALLFPLSPEAGLRPVGFERGDQFLDDRRALDEHTHFAPLVQLELAQALTADEGVPAIADNGADVEPMPRILLVDQIRLPASSPCR